MTLAEKLLSLRTEQDMSQEDLAEKMEVSRQSVSKWETGQSVPDLDKIIKLADLFGVTVDELVRDGTPPQNSAEPQKSERPLKRRPHWDPVWPWLEEKGHRTLAACVLLALVFPASALELGGVSVLALLIISFEILLVKKGTMGWVLVTLIIATGLYWPDPGMGFLVSIFVSTPLLIILRG